MLQHALRLPHTIHVGHEVNMPRRRETTRTDGGDIHRLRQRLDQTTVRSRQFIHRRQRRRDRRHLLYVFAEPCFILVGGSLIENTDGNPEFTAPLTGITAAVVGVILNLAVFFAYHVLWPQGFGGAFEWLSALIGIAAFSAL